MVERRRTRAQKKTEKSYRTPKLYLLGFTILSCFSLFVYWITKSDRVGAYVASVSITKYREGLPEIQKKWASNDITPKEELAQHKQSQLVPVTLNGDQELQNQVNINNLIGEIKTQDQDLPLVVLLRCHAQAIKSQQGYDCNLLTEEDDEQYLLKDFIQQLKAVPARNIIVLADICDLSFLPSEGIIVNPIATSILDTCKHLNESIGEDLKKSGRNIWIMCPSADGQISHRDRDGTTLFQSACRAAFDTKDEEVTLRSFYQYVLSHVHEWSAGTQTPLLFSVRQSDQSEHVVRLDGQLAQEVRLSRFEKNISKEETASSEESDKKKKDDPETTLRGTIPSSPNSRHSVKLVRLATLPDELAKPSVEKDNSSTQAEIDKKPSTTPTSFRDYHESFKRRDRNDSWNWHGAQFDALNYRLSLQESADPEKSELRLKEWLERNGPSDARQAFKDSGFSERIVGYWEAPDKLAPKYRGIWEGTRDRYIQYAVGISEFLFWRNLVVNLKEATYQFGAPVYDESISALASQFEVFSNSLIQLRAAMPNDDETGAIKAMANKEKSIGPPVDTTVFQQSLKRLVNELLERSEGATKENKGAKNNSTAATWTAVEESLLQTLIAFPLLDASLRKQLNEVETQTSKLKNWQLAINSLPSIEKLNRSLKQASPKETPFSPSHWKNKLVLESLRVIEKLCGFDKPVGNRSSDSITSYSDAQSNLLNRFKNRKESGGSEDPGSPFIFAINRWHFYHLGEKTNELKKVAEKDRHGVAGIIVSPAPVKDTTLYLIRTPNNERFLELKLDSKSPQSTERVAKFSLKVEFLGTDATPKSCILKWDFKTEDANGRNPAGVSIQSSQKQPWKAGEFAEFPVASGEISFEIRLPSGESLPLRSILEITKADDSEKLRIPVFADANRIELVFENEEGRKFFARDNVLELTGPCFKDTKAVYSCYLVNKLPRERTATVEFFKDKEGKQPLLKSEGEIVALQPADLQNIAEPARRKIQLTPIKEEKLKGLFPKVLYALIQETGPNSPKPERIEIRFDPILPEDQTTWAITTEPRDLGSVAEVKFSIPNTPQNPAKTTIELGNVQLPDYDKYTGVFAPIEITKDEPKILKFPALESDKRYLFAVQIGDYPRAIFFEQNAKADSKIAAVTRPGRLRVKSIDGIAPEDSERPIIFKSFDDTSKERPLIIENYSSLTLDIEADSPNQKVSCTIQSEGLDDGEINPTPLLDRTFRDRTFRPILDAEGGNFAVSFDVSELREEIYIGDWLPRENETRKLVLSLNVDTGSEPWKRTLLFDRAPPNANARFYKSLKGNNAITFIEISEGVQPIFYLRTQDGDGNKESGLSEAYFELGIKDQSRNKAERIPEEACTMKPTQDGFSVALNTGNDFWVKRKGNDLVAYLVTTDKAGNEQRDHPPLTIIWKSTKSTPATKPQ